MCGDRTRRAHEQNPSARFMDHPSSTTTRVWWLLIAPITLTGYDRGGGRGYRHRLRPNHGFLWLGGPPGARLAASAAHSELHALPVAATGRGVPCGAEELDGWVRVAALGVAGGLAPAAASAWAAPTGWAGPAAPGSSRFAGSSGWAHCNSGAGPADAQRCAARWAEPSWNCHGPAGFLRWGPVRRCPSSRMNRSECRDSVAVADTGVGRGSCRAVGSSAAAGLAAAGLGAPTNSWNSGRLIPGGYNWPRSPLSPGSAAGSRSAGSRRDVARRQSPAGGNPPDSSRKGKDRSNCAACSRNSCNRKDHNPTADPPC